MQAKMLTSSLATSNYWDLYSYDYEPYLAPEYVEELINTMEKIMRKQNTRTNNPPLIITLFSSCLILMINTLMVKMEEILSATKCKPEEVSYFWSLSYFHGCPFVLVHVPVLLVILLVSTSWTLWLRITSTDVSSFSIVLSLLSGIYWNVN